MSSKTNLQQSEYFKNYKIQQVFNSGINEWQLISFKKKDCHKKKPKQALLRTYHKEAAYKNHLNLIKILPTDHCLNLLYNYETLTEYRILFDCHNKFPLFTFLDSIRTFSELRQIAVFVKIFNTIKEINDKGFFFEYFEISEIFVNKFRNVRDKEGFDLDDSEIFIFAKPENFFKQVKVDDEMKLRRKWHRKQKIVLGKVLFELVTGKVLKESSDADKVLIDVSSRLDYLGYSMQYIRMFTDILTKNHSLYPELSDISQAFTSIAFKKKLYFKDSVKLMKSSQKKIKSSLNENCCKVFKIEDQGLKFNLIIPSTSKKFTNFYSFKIPKKILFQSDLDTISCSSIPDDNKSISFRSSYNELFIQGKEEFLGNNSSKLSNKEYVNEDETTKKYKRRSLNIESCNILNSINKNEFKNMYEESDTKSINKTSEDYSEYKYNTIESGRGSGFSNFFSKCGKCGKENPNMKLDCDHYYHNRCLDEIFKSNSATNKQIFCVCCFKPIDTSNIQDINAGLFNSYQKSKHK